MQNIPDVWIREARNEPSNLPYVVEAIAKALQLDTPTLSATLTKNTKTFFNLQDKEDFPIDTQIILDKAQLEEKEETKNEEEKEEEEEEEEEEKEETDNKDTHPEVKAVSSEEDSDEIKYTCKKCRKVLCSSKQILSHGTNSGDLFVSKLSKKSKARTVEVGVCQMLFLKEQNKWDTISRGAMDDEEEESAQLPTVNTTLSTLQEGKLFCPQCMTKLGRFSLLSSIPCSCGTCVSAPCCFLLYIVHLWDRYDTQEVLGCGNTE